MRDVERGRAKVGDDLGDLRVYASASVARSSAFLNRAVAMSSIVRVIFLMFCTDFRRLMIARALAMDVSLGKGVDRAPGTPRERSVDPGRGNGG